MATRRTDSEAAAPPPPAPSTPSLPIEVAWSASDPDPDPDLHSDEDSDAQRIESRFHLPPHHLASDTALYEGDAPNVLADNVLLHPPSAAPRPSIGSRASSWRSALFDTPQRDASSLDEAARSDPKNRRRRRRRDDDDDDDHRYDDNGDQQQGESEEEEEDHRDEHARNKSRYRKMPWHKRPSPIWFIPGTLVFALTMGMTIAPKLEIYTQLICRALPVDESGVTVPPPMIELGAGGGGGGVVGTPGPVWNKHPLNTTTSGSASSTSTILLEWNDYGSKATNVSSRAASASNSPISDGEWAKQCHKSRAVQSQVAQLALLLSLLMGILSSLTTGFWGAFSDRRGRKPVLILALCGSLAMDVVFLLTVYYHSTLSYNFLLLGPILDGLVGGYSTAQATTAAYVSDTTSPGSRAKIFSAIGGLMYGGFAIGPVLGSFLITHSSSRLGVLAPFYAALAMHAAYLLFLAVLLPESLSRERQQAARDRHEAERAERRRLDHEEQAHGRSRWRKVLKTAARPLAFLKPVALLLPQKPRSGGSTTTGTTPPVDPEDRTNIEWGAHLSEYWNPEEVWKSPDPNKTMLGAPGAGGADWTLTKIAAAWACYMCIMAVMSVKLMYANYTFGWGAAEDGYYLSFLGVLRVVMLVGLIPLLIKLVRRKPAPIPMRPRPAGPSKEATTWDHEKRWLRVVHDSHFDLALARWSLLLDLFGFALFLLAPYLLPSSLRGSSQHIALFLTAAVLQSMGSGASPAIQSLALAHASPRDAGRLFASLSVVQSIASQVIGPILFSVLFMQTVGRWSEAVFALASLFAAVAVGTLSLVKLRTVVVPEPAAYRDRDHHSGQPDLESSGAGRLGRGSEYEFDTSATPNLRFDKSSSTTTTTTTTPAMMATEDLVDVDADAADSSPSSQALRGRKRSR